MAFLDNSGDIILDAVLTDTGRFRLAKGDGSFKISKFALGDDEIDYSNYNKAHASGSAYFDLEVLQTPVLEAFTNNTSTMKSKLLSIPRNNLLYLPIMKLNGLDDSQMFSGGTVSQTYLVACDLDTLKIFKSNNQVVDGVLQGFRAGTDNVDNNFIRIDQGLDTQEISPAFSLDSDLLETQYILEIDDRLGQIARGGKDVTGQLLSPAAKSFIDDDQIASYYLSEGANADYVRVIDDGQPIETGEAQNQVIQGPRGTKLQFSVLSSLDLQHQKFLFQTLGGSGNASTVYGRTAHATETILHIDTVIRVTGATTGYRLDVPVRFVRKN